MQRLSSLKLPPVFNVNSNSVQSLALLELFITSCGGNQAHRNMFKLEFNDSMVHWQHSLLAYTNEVLQLMYPLVGSSINWFMYILLW